MAFDVKDFFREYSKRGDIGTPFNIARQDNTNAEEAYYGYQNDEGAYLIQQVTTDGTLVIKVYKYFASNKLNDFQTDWDNRASLTYGEYHALFLKDLS